MKDKIKLTNLNSKERGEIIRNLELEIQELKAANKDLKRELKRSNKKYNELHLKWQTINLVMSTNCGVPSRPVLNWERVDRNYYDENHLI